MRFSLTRRRICGIFVAAALVVLLFESTILQTIVEVGTDSLIKERRENVVAEDSMIVYRAYLDRRVPSKSVVRILAFSRCFSADLRVQINSIPAEVTPIEGQCPWKWAPKCAWNSFLISAEISNPSSHILLWHSNRSLLLPVTPKTTPSRPGLAVCVPPLYWFSNWPSIVMFLEIWRIQGASRFFVYVHSATVATREVLRFYEQQGILSVIPWNELPSHCGVNPNLSLYRLGHSLAHNDCVFRSNYRFTALVDVDELVMEVDQPLISSPRNRSLVDFLSHMLKSHPNAGSFIFSHAKIRFDDQDWSEVDFSFLKKAFVERGNGPPKVIFRPDRTEILLTHQVRSHFAPFSGVQVPRERALLLHARSNWAQQNAPGDFNPIAVFSDNDVGVVTDAYNAALNFLRESAIESAINANVSLLVQQCLKGWKDSGCKTPFYACYGALHHAEKWIYSFDWNDYAVL